MRFGLRLQLLIPFLIFTLAGSIILLLSGQAWIQRASSEEFKQKAESTAAFYSGSNLPASPQMAKYLGTILGSEVEFLTTQAGSGVVYPELEETVASVQNRQDILAIRLSRERQPNPSVWRTPSLRYTLFAFWLGAVFVAYIVSRNVIGPLLHFTRSLPQITGTGRNDEIGDLARRFHHIESARSSAEKRSALSDLAAGFAHEVKNPLAAARIHVELVNDPQHSPIIIQQLDRVERLVHQWQYLLRPETPKTTPTPVNDLLTAMYSRLEPLAEHADVHIEIEETNLVLPLDRNRMEQVFDNLAVNAIQAMPNGGLLRVYTNGRRIVFSDTGKGFSKEGLQNAGELFYSTKEGGMGIGIHLSQQIVEAHGARLVCGNRTESGREKPLGARVEIIFPVTPT